MQEDGVSKVAVDQLSSLINAVYEGINQQLNTHILKRETPPPPPPPAQKPNDDDGEKEPEVLPQTPKGDEEIGEKRDETSTFSSPVEEGVELTEESLVRKNTSTCI